MALRIETSMVALAAGLAATLAAAPAAAQTNYVIASGTTDTTQKTVAGTDTVTVQAGGTLAPATNPAINWNNASTGLVITNSGTIRSTSPTGRAIGTSGAANVRSVTLTNNVGGLIESADDAFRISVNPTGGTIIVNNFGIIRTTNGGQAIDFDAIATNAASVTINNAAGAELRSFGQDAVRPGQGAVLTNAGLIYSDGPINNSYDGVDWQARSGVVVNQATGVISGLRHGITSDVSVDVTNRGTITGRNGSGVGSDGTGVVVNTGTITGTWDGVSTNGDGDGVDIDFIGTVRNSGTIQGLTAAGVDSGGRPNSAQGVAMGGGLVENNAGATIYGGAQGVLINHDTNVGGVADGVTTVTNLGTIRGGSAEGIVFVGAFNDTITTSGLIAGGAGTALDMGDGDDALNVGTGASFIGTVNGGAGTDTITLAGTGNGALNASVNFERLNVTAGLWMLNGVQAFAQGTTIANARLNALGTLGGPVTVGSGGTLGGTGTVGNVTVASGGTVAPGTGIGALNVAGTYLQGTGSTYAAETAASGLSDRIVVSGAATIQTGATLALTRDAGVYAPGTRFVLLTAAGGITGGYTIVTQTISGGIELRYGQSANSVYVDAARTGASLVGVGQNPNQVAVGAAFGTLGAGNAAYAALTLEPDDAALRRAFDALAGDVHGAVRTALVRDAGQVQHAVLARVDERTGSGLWGSLLIGSGDDAGAAGGADATRYTRGATGGVDIGLGDALRLGVAGGYTRDDLDARASEARLETVHVMGYAGARLGAVRLRAGGGYGWTKVDSARTIGFAGFSAANTAEYDANTLHGFAEIGVAVPVMGSEIEPFAGVEGYRVSTDGFAETGGATALRSGRDKASFAIGKLGVKVTTPIVAGVSGRARFGWEHVIGDTAPVSTLAFANGASFRVTGTTLSRDAAAARIGLAWAPSKAVRIAIDYDGRIGGQDMDSSGRVTLGIGF